MNEKRPSPAGSAKLSIYTHLTNPGHAALMSILLTSNLLTKEGNRIFRPFGLTESQVDTLMLLKYRGGRDGLDQSSLSRMLVVNRANVTGIIDRLERDGLVRRAPDPEDRRLKRVVATKKGLDALAPAELAYVCRVGEIIAVLSPAEREALCQGLEKIRAAIGGPN